MRTTLIPLRKHIRQVLQEKREILIYNLSALKFIRDTQAPNMADMEEGSANGVQEVGQEARILKRKRVKV